MQIEPSTMNVFLVALLGLQSWQVRQIFKLNAGIESILSNCPTCKAQKKPRLGVVLSVLFILGIVAVTGCASTTAPTALERRLFTVTTNWVPSVVTNQVPVEIEVVTWHTNEIAGVVTIAATTNRTIETAPVAVTNWTAMYDLEKAAGAATVQGVAKAAATPFGFGDLAGVVVGGILGLWGALRSSKARKVSKVLAQGIETSRALLATTPQGAELDARLKAHLLKDQKTAGVLESVLPLLREIDPQLAEMVAERLAKPA